MKKEQAITIIRKTRQDYNTIAKEWDKSRFVPSPLKLDLISDLKPGMNVLDLGCGNGFLVAHVLQKGASYIGVDFSKQLISLAKKKYQKEIKQGHVKFLLGDASRHLRLKKDFFDRVYCFAVLHHIPSEELRIETLGRIYGILKIGGIAKIIVWNLLNRWPRNRFRVDEQLKNPEKGLEKGDLLIPWKATTEKTIWRYIHLFTKKEAVSSAKKAGFKKNTLGYFNRAGERKKNGEEMVIELKKIE